MDGAWRRPPKSLADYGHTEPKRGAEWWGKSVLLTFALFKSEPLSERNPKRPLPQQWICTQSNCVDCQAAFASKPAHSLIVGHQVDRRRLLPQLICSACSSACLHLMITTRHLPFTMGEFVQIVQVIHIEPAILLAGTTEEADADIQLTQQFWA